MYQLVIKNALIYDGSGAPAFLGSVGIADGKIIYVGPNDPGEYGGMYSTHSRSESIGLFDSVRECIHIARDGKVPVNISHFKCVGKAFWQRCTEALAMIDAAVEEGSPFETTFVMTCTNGLHNYIAAEYAFQGRGVYEVHNRSFVQGTAEELADTFLEMLKFLAQ